MNKTAKLLIRIAYENPNLEARLLPVIKLAMKGIKGKNWKKEVSFLVWEGDRGEKFGGSKSMRHPLTGQREMPRYWSSSPGEEKELRKAYSRWLKWNWSDPDVEMETAERVLEDHGRELSSKSKKIIGRFLDVSMSDQKATPAQMEKAKKYVDFAWNPSIRPATTPRGMVAIVDSLSKYDGMLIEIKSNSPDVPKQIYAFSRGGNQGREGSIKIALGDNTADITGFDPMWELSYKRGAAYVTMSNKTGGSWPVETIRHFSEDELDREDEIDWDEASADAEELYLR